MTTSTGAPRFTSDMVVSKCVILLQQKPWQGCMDDKSLLKALEGQNEERICAVLRELMGVDVSVERVKKFGVHVNRVRKEAAFKEAAPLAINLLQKWKPLLLGSKDAVAPPSPAIADAARTPLDPVRAKCIEMLHCVLGDPDQQVAEEVEQSLFDEFGRTSSSYRAKFRSKYLNLKQNKALREQLVFRVVSAERFSQMTAAEMASSEVKAADAVFQAKALRDSQAAQDTEAETDQFKCGRCGKRKCKYYQLQTRSADEPMTTFVTCVNCGNRWKFC